MDESQITPDVLARRPDFLQRATSRIIPQQWQRLLLRVIGSGPHPHMCLWHPYSHFNLWPWPGSTVSSLEVVLYGLRHFLHCSAEEAQGVDPAFLPLTWTQDLTQAVHLVLLDRTSVGLEVVNPLQCLGRFPRAREAFGLVKVRVRPDRNPQSLVELCVRQIFERCTEEIYHQLRASVFHAEAREQQHLVCVKTPNH